MKISGKEIKVKLIGTSQKKKTVMFLSVGLFMVIILLLAGLVKLGIFTNKLKADVVYEPEVEYKIGDKFCLNGDSDCFYVIDARDSSYVKALSEYSIDPSQNAQSQSAPTLSFSNTNYWHQYPTENPISDYGSSYPVKVFNSNSNLYTPLKNYENYLKDQLGFSSAGLSLITRDELGLLGCPTDTDYINCNGSGDYEWL